LVAKEYTQIYGIDYEETFAPVAKMNTVRILLPVEMNQKWTLHQMDVKNAFLHGILKEEVYMAPPPTYIQQGNSNLACKLEKSIYGLKQSP
jgi:Reverse transcriptase (RNA-dependent DNA polymerase)